MNIRAIGAAVLLSTLPAAGCGTVTNLARTNTETGGRVPFGGVKQDLACLQSASDEHTGIRRHSTSESEPYPRAMLACFCAIDLPFSLVGDLVTWPYTWGYTVVNEPIPTTPITFADGPAAVPAPLPVPPAPKSMPVPVPPPLPAAKDAAKTDAPKTDATKVDPPKIDIPKIDPPKTLPKPSQLP